MGVPLGPIFFEESRCFLVCRLARIAVYRENLKQHTTVSVWCPLSWEDKTYFSVDAYSVDTHSSWHLFFFSRWQEQEQSSGQDISYFTRHSGAELLVGLSCLTPRKKFCPDVLLRTSCKNSQTRAARKQWRNSFLTEIPLFLQSMYPPLCQEKKCTSLRAVHDKKNIGRIFASCTHLCKYSVKILTETTHLILIFAHCSYSCIVRI